MRPKAAHGTTSIGLVAAFALASAVHAQLPKQPYASYWKPDTSAHNLPKAQLYNLTHDAGEERNLVTEHPEIVARLTGFLEKSIADGRTTPGPRQHNDASIEIDRRPNVSSKAVEEKVSSPHR